MSVPELLRRYWLQGLLTAVIAVLAGYFFYTGRVLVNARALLYRKNFELTEYLKVDKEYRAKDAAFALYRARLSEAPMVLMPLPLIEEMGRKIGIANKLSLTPIDFMEKGGYRTEGARVSMKGVNLGELVNLLYRIDGQKGLMMVKSFSMGQVPGKGDVAPLFEADMEVVQIVKVAGESMANEAGK